MASFGEKLRHERELRGVNLRQVADATKISIRFLRALEEDRVDVLPGGLFPKAFVKQYATFLGLDPETLATEFAAVHGQAANPDRHLMRKSDVSERPRFTPLHAVVGLVLVVAVGLALRRVGGNPERREIAPAPPVVAAPAVLPTDRVYPLASRADAPAAATGLQLTLKADQECWVEVRADGQARTNRVLTPGETLSFEARGEIVLSVGNAGGLQVRLNDRPALPLGRSGEVRKNIVITRQSLPSMVEQEPTETTAGQQG